MHETIRVLDDPTEIVTVQIVIKTTKQIITLEANSATQLDLEMEYSDSFSFLENWNHNRSGQELEEVVFSFKPLKDHKGVSVTTKVERRDSDE